MTRLNTIMMLGLMCAAHQVDAQPVARPTEPARSVTLTLAEYNRLTDLAGRTPTTAPLPPIAAVLSSAELRVRVDGPTARGLFTLAGETLRAGISRVRLLSGATVLEASTEGRPLPLLADGKSHAALLAGPGPFTVDLEWGAPLTFKPGLASFALPVPPAGAVRVTIDVPGDQADIHLSAGWITRRISSNGRTIVEATLDPASSTEVSWSMRDSAPVAAAREARTLADVMTLMTLGDSDVRMVALVDLSVLQGEPRTFEMRLPAGYQLTGISGSTIETSEPLDGSVRLRVVDPAFRRHQFLVTLERSHGDGSFTFDTDFVSVADVQRERGEVAVEGVGTLDLTTSERSGIHRIDVREIAAPLSALARMPLLSAFRYQRAAGPSPGLTLAVARFPDSSVLAASVEHAVATTLVTAEGRALTEVILRVRNRAQPFLKVRLPEGATIVSVEVAGQPVKPVTGNDGDRVPLLRRGFRSSTTYQVSFVYLHAGTPFGRKGEIHMLLPRMDIPISVVQWEIFAPGNYALRYVDGNAIDQRTLDRALAREATAAKRADSKIGQGGGRGSGSGSGSGVGVGSLNETVTASGSSPAADQEAKAEPSQNVLNLQRRVAGVLPIQVDVPRAGAAYRFTRPLVVDDETTVTFKYKRR